MVLSKDRGFTNRRLSKGSMCTLRRVSFDVVERDERSQANFASVRSRSFHLSLHCIALFTNASDGFATVCS